MVTQLGTSKTHWNYFLALERDMEVVTRFVEFNERNFSVYSIELAHLLFAAASEVDVVAKLLCKRVAPNDPCRNIDEYRGTLLRAVPGLPRESVFVPRYGLVLEPWLAWEDDKNPLWWRAYNDVKHQRDVHFQDATLQNALHALGALLLLTINYYAATLPPPDYPTLLPRDVTSQLLPESSLLRLDASHYHGAFILRR